MNFVKLRQRKKTRAVAHDGSARYACRVSTLLSAMKWPCMFPQRVYDASGNVLPSEPASFLRRLLMKHARIHASGAARQLSVAQAFAHVFVALLQGLELLLPWRGFALSANPSAVVEPLTAG